MYNKLNFLYFHNCYLVTLLQDKTIFPLYNKYFNNINFSFFIKNNNQHRILFLLKIMLLEKLTANKLKFIINMRLLRKRILKVGGNILISHNKINFILLSFFYYSLPKLIYSFGKELTNYYEFYDLKLNVYKEIFFVLTKFLFINYFSYTGDYHTYHNLFENSIYQLKLKINTNFNSYLINRELMRLVGTNII